MNQSNSGSGSRQLPRKLRAGYGLAEMGITSTQIITQLYLLEHYTQVMGLQASLAGIALAISVLWDAVSDPLMGVVSDRTRSRFGRRRPYILFGSILLGITIGFLFSPPQLSSQILLFGYLLFTYVMVNTAMTILSVPHLALGGELSTDSKIRTELFGWRLFFSNLGILFGMILPAVLLQNMGDENSSENVREARSIAAWAIGCLVFISGYATFQSTGSVSASADSNPISDSHSEAKFGFLDLIKSFRQVLGNKIFLPLLIAFIIATFGRTFNTAIALFYYKFRLGLKESEVVLQILFPFFVIIILSIPFWIYLSDRYGKKIPAFFGILILGLVTMIAYPLYPYGDARFPLITAVIGGICAGSIFLLDSLVADIVDYDELKTGDEKEGLYFGFWKMGTKFAQALGLAVSGVLLDVIGIVQGSDTQSPETGYRLAIVFGPVVGAFFVLGAIVFLWMPLTDSVHKRIKKLLDRKKRIRLEKREH
ncbi:MFS transporter [Leptospira sp. GIMC2001]|uniref:MFS transporter n=1 Tax=Leptospira sp. GIMC2001 TaxID=1513297 RepID=UPI00234B24BB|nr:MFS transporter [Leptospira sp. GIMC2001]WCL49720.1 MFS transporter [Leptospira sp. GIMC2001]